ncbi:hypothetical protein MNBD_GAMMA06-1227 [hydrothermal vent metagenome]|uniref:Lipoprotein n=1 Tax=hydrothermal vent metagenome TaxID=652676 RepID=A0A3B0WTI5_9ZZZZ
MKKNTLILTLLATSALTLASCASIKGTVYKQKSGDYKATYSAKTEAEALKVVHSDAKITCKEKGGKTPAVVDEKVSSLTEDTEKTGEGFAAVAGSAVSAVDKYFSSEVVRAELTFDCT